MLSGHSNHRMVERRVLEGRQKQATILFGPLKAFSFLKRERVYLPALWLRNSLINM